MAKAKMSKPAATKKVRKTEATSLHPVKESLTKSALINLVAEQNDIPRKTAAGVFATLENVLLGSVHPRGVGEFTSGAPESDSSQSAGSKGRNSTTSGMRFQRRSGRGERYW
jgi:hypothetical protein